ncbi:MAG TPA: DUF2339 domain-containing protein [Bacteroidales bacterium]|nr:DUF2339 domain-containing protein [Bacteroidales bacterium]
MEVINTLFIITIFIIILINNSLIKDKLDKIGKDLNSLKDQLCNQPTRREPERKMQQETILPPPAVTPVQEKKPEPEPVKASSIEELYANPAQQVVAEKPTIPVQKVQKPQKPKVKGDWEKFIGENLMSKIGIAILVLGIGYFVKYAIDKDYINEFGRTAIGFIVGGGIIALAHRMRKDYKTFASILIGGGLAILYTTVTIAYQLYNLFPQAAAFAILIIITIFAVLLSLLYDKRELAIISLIGGFASPFMVSTGAGNYIVLFTYLLILNAGMVVIAWHKRWNILNLLGYIFTLLLFGGWLVDTFMWNSGIKPYVGAITFATLFYLGFFLVNILNNIRKYKPFNGIEIGMILSNNLFYFLGGLLIVDSLQNGLYNGLFTVIIGIYNFAWVLYFYKKEKIDRTFLFLLIGLVLSFISLAIPIQLHGHSITMFWAAEVVILLWISQVSGIKMLKAAHLIILGLTILSLLMDWNNGYLLNAKVLPVFLNQICITGLIVVIAIVLSILLLRKEKESMFIKYLLDVKTYSSILSALLFTGLYAVLFYELVYQMNRMYNVTVFRHAVYGVFNFTYLAAYVIVCRRQQWVLALKVLYYLSLFLLFIFLVFYSTRIIGVREEYLLYHTLSQGNFLFHYLIYPGIAVVLAFIIQKRNEIFKAESALSQITLWYTTFIIVLAASIELDNIVLWVNLARLDNEYALLKEIHKTGYSILWACAAFVLMIIGMKAKNKVFRIQAISLLGLIIVKLLLFDVWKMNEGGRIATFIFLGVTLLVISFLYQKLKKLILDNENKEPANEQISN